MSLIRIPAGLRLLTAASLGLSAMNARADGAPPDLDGDGVPNLVDPDIDSDGIPNALDENIDGGIARSGPFAGQYLGDSVNNDNPAERDIDDDGLADDSLGETDTDGDGKTDSSAFEDDTDGDGRTDTLASERDIDGDGRLDDDGDPANLFDDDDDIDGDSLDDDDFAENDIDGDNSSDSLDGDIDGDSRGNSVIDDDDVDGDGRPNGADDEEDDDGDGAHDRDDDDDNNDGTTDEDDDYHHDEDDEIEQKVTLAPGPLAPSGGSARIELQSMATGKLELKIRGYDLPAGDYDIVIGGIVRGTLEMLLDDEELRGKTEFETGHHDDGELPLDFPVAAEPVSLVQGGIVLFSGIIPTPPPPPSGDDDDHHEHTYIQLLTRAAAAPAEAKAEAEIDVGIAGVTVFEVEIEDLPAGIYEVAVDGVLRGTVAVIDLPGQTRGELRFETVPEGGDEILLDFPVVGLPVAISQGASLYFSGTIPGGG